jgi:hypothetical protein
LSKEAGMKNFLIVLAVSIVASVELWNFGLAAKIWPAHPLIATTVLATVIAMAIQMYLRSDARRAKSRTNPPR